MSTFRLFKVAVLFAAAMYFEGCGKKDDSKPNAASPSPAVSEDEQSGDVPESSPGTGTEFGDGSTAVAGSPVVNVNSISGGPAINDVCIQLRLYNLFSD